MITAVVDVVFGMINAVGFIIGGFAMVVGGFSIANIMFVSAVIGLLAGIIPAYMASRLSPVDAIRSK